MDIFAHGLWSVVVYSKVPPKNRYWAVFFGVAPDLFSFGIFFVYRLWSGILPIAKPELSSIPTYVNTLYNISHSLVVWLIVVLLIYLWRKKIPWVLGAWALHIVIDIFSHAQDFFPTPFLWPISDFKVDGYSWGHPLFMAINYSALAIFYIVWLVVKRRRSAVKSVSHVVNKS
ncbi:MAG: hypothetical protein AAB657_03760 [Patescibacteria group bacterium]